MDIKTMTFGTVTQASYDKACKYIKGVGKRLTVEFDAAVTFGVAAVYATGDVTHINKVIPLMKIARLEPMLKRVLVGFDIIPFGYDDAASQFTGKINQGRAAQLKIVDVNGVPQWELLLKAALAGQKPENKPKKAFNLQSRCDSMTKAAREAGCTDLEIKQAERASLKTYPAIAPDSTVASADDRDKAETAKADLERQVAAA